MSFKKYETSAEERMGWKNFSRMMGLNHQRSIVFWTVVVLILLILILLIWTNYLQGSVEVRVWLELLLIILALCGGAMLFIWSIRRNEQQAEHELKMAEWYAQHERELEAQRFQESAFQTYLDRMTDLLLQQRLRRSKPGDEVRDIARARTLTTLRGLDGAHKGILLRFLHEADLIKTRAIIDLHDANLRGADLSKAKLSGADLSGADLSGADLSEADLSQANLSGAVMIVTNLNGANLNGTNLTAANLTEVAANGTHLSRANLSQADLHGANLESADLSGASLAGANLAGAIVIDVNLSQANLSQSTLTRTNLSQADLSQANLSQADVSWANLSWANLGHANLTQAELHGANLEGAEIIGCNLNEAKSLKGARMPDNREHQ